MLRRLRFSLVAVLVSVALVGASCARGKAEADIQERNEDIPMVVSVALKGDLAVKVTKRKVLTKMIVVTGDDVSVAQRVLGVEVVDPIAEGPVKVKPGVAIVAYRGDGRYTIPVGSPYDAVKAEEEAKRTGKPRNRSSVKVEWWPADREPEFYLRREKPCTVKVDDGGMKGSVRCPQMTQEGSGDRRFSLEFSWEAA